MALGQFLSNQGTQTGIIVDTIGGSVMAIQKLDISPLGADGTIWGGGVTGTINTGSIAVTAGTINSLPNIPGGTINVGTSQMSSGTLNIGTVNTGTINTGTVNTGTVNTGTINVATVTAGSIVVTAGTFIGAGGSVISYGPAAAAAAAAGNPLNIGGTDSGGTIRTIKVDSGGLQRIGLDSGTISVLPNLPQGSINVTAGTIASVGTIGTLGLGTITGNVGVSSGTINVGTVTSNQATGTLNVGTINTGTFVGKDANAAAQTGNPVGVGGTDSGGTIRTIKVDSGGLLRVGIDSGTISVLPNIPGGTINILAGGTLGILTNGTISSSGTTTGVGVVSMLSAGTISMINAGTLGTITNLGSVTNIGQVYNAGTIATGANTIGNIGSLLSGTLNIGTFVGKDANAVAQTGNPISVGGTDSGGTVRTVLVDSTGAMKVNGVSAGTTVGTINAGTINIGTIIKQSPAPTAGSFTAAGTITQAGSQFDSGAFDIGGTWVGTVFTEGQIGTSSWFSIPFVNSAGAVGTSFTGNGDYFVDAGALDGVRARLTFSSGTLTYNARQSSFESPIISIYGGTLGNLGTLNSGTIGTVTGAGTVTNLGSVTNVGQLYNAGTVQNQLAGTLTALQNGTITAGSIIVTGGTVSAGTINTGTINTGTFVMTAGTLSPIPTIANVTYGTHGTTGVSIFGTLAGGTGSGAGTEIFITSLSLTIPSTGRSQDASIGWGTNGGTFQAGTGLLVRGNFPPGGGIQKNFSPPSNSGTNAQLCLFQAGAGTVDVSVTYFITTSAL